MRLALPLVAVALLLSACGGATHEPSLGDARERSVEGGSASFAQTTSLRLGGSTVEAHDTGTSSLTRRRAHIYKLVPGNAIPGEVIVVGAVTYTNANVQAALADPSVQPWTKLDTRRLTDRERASHPDELAHVLAPLYLADGVAEAKRIGSREFRGVVDPARVVAQLPRTVKTTVADALRNDYPAEPFPARFWLDARGRLARVSVSYTTAQGTPVRVDTRYSAYGSAVDVTPPPASDVENITPR